MKKNNIMSILGVASLLSLSACSDQINYSLESTAPRVVDTTVANIPKETVKDQKESFYFALNKTSNDTALKYLGVIVNKLQNSKSKVKLEADSTDKCNCTYK